MLLPSSRGQKLRARRAASTTHDAVWCVRVGEGSPSSLLDDSRITFVVCRGFRGRGGAFAGLVARLAEDLTPFERLERDLRLRPALGARDVELRALGSYARNALGARGCRAGGFGAVGRGRARRSIVVARRARGAIAALGRSGAPSRSGVTRSGIARRAAESVRARGAIPTRRSSAEAAAITARSSIAAEATRLPRRTAVPEAALRAWSAAAESAARRSSVAESASGAKCWTPPVRIGRAARRASVSAAIAEPRRAAISPALRACVAPTAASPLGLCLPRLAARLASLRRRREPALGIERLLGLAKQERTAALGARDLLVAHRESFFGRSRAMCPSCSKRVRE
jgi:hypothetical protein